MKTGWKIVIVVVIIAATITFASLFYFIWNGFSGTGPMIPSVATSKAPVTGGWQINILAISHTVSWDDIKVQLDDGTDSVGWSIKAADLDGGFNITASYATKLLGTLSVVLTVTDNSGNGFVSSTNYLTLTANPAFSSATTYSAVLIYEPVGGPMPGGVTFTGV